MCCAIWANISPVVNCPTPSGRSSAWRSLRRPHQAPACTSGCPGPEISLRGDSLWTSGSKMVLKGDVMIRVRASYDFHPKYTYMCRGCFMIKVIYDQLTQPWKLNRTQIHPKCVSWAVKVMDDTARSSVAVEHLLCVTTTEGEWGYKFRSQETLTVRIIST